MHIIVDIKDLKVRKGREIVYREKQYNEETIVLNLLEMTVPLAINCGGRVTAPIIRRREGDYYSQ